MSALAMFLLAAAVSGAVGVWAHIYHRGRRDTAWADDTMRWLRSMRELDFDEHCAAALYVVGDDLERRRVDQTISRHPAKGVRR